MTKQFTPNHQVRTFTHEVAAPPGEVFPQLCPTREYDWIPGWSCELVHSRSGYAELGCVFQREAPFGKGTWVVCRYEPNRHIAFVIHYPDVMTEQLDVEVEDLGDGRSRVTWTRRFTGLSPRGNEATLLYAEAFDPLHRWLGRALDAYCSTGRMTEEPIPAFRR